MSTIRLLLALPLALLATAAAADGPRGHVLGPDLARLAAGPAVAPRTASPGRGHALGPDVAALRTPIGCAANPHPASACAPGEVASED